MQSPSSQGGPAEFGGHYAVYTHPGFIVRNVIDSRIYRQFKAWELTDSAARLERFGT
jgi:hypothetical protein